jgi:hypothetical protein
MRFQKNNRQIKNSNEDVLKNKIISLLDGSGYSLDKFKLDSKCFGNIILEIIDKKDRTRFIYDRGDIYRNKKIHSSEHWLGEMLIFSHEEKDSETYGLLFRAIKNYIGLGV